MDLQEGCSVGQNFVAEVFRAKLDLQSSSSKEFIQSVFVKKFPNPDSPSHSYFNCSDFFKNEVIVYEMIVPQLEKETNGKKLDLPRYLGRCCDLIILEDLKDLGYAMGDGFKGLNFDQCSGVLKSLSLLHASSMSVQRKRNVEDVMSGTVEAVLRKENIEGIGGVGWENALTYATRSLKSSDSKKHQEISDSLMRYSGSVLDTLIQTVQPSKVFGVMCHGDLWFNNIMFRHGKDGNEIETKLVDLQGIRYASCALDILHFLLTSSQPEVLKTEFYRLLALYYENLRRLSQEFEFPLEFTCQELLQEMKNRVNYGLFYSFLAFTTFSMQPAAETEDPNTGKSQHLSPEYLSSDKTKDKIYKSLSPQYHNRLHGLLDGLLEIGFIGCES